MDDGAQVDAVPGIKPIGKAHQRVESRKVSMTAPCAIEYILVTRWRGGKKGGQNRVCACDTRDRGVNKKLKPEHPSETVVMPESGERKRNLTTLVLVKNAAVKRSRSRQKVSESSQNPLSSSRRRERARQGRSNVR